MERPILVSRFSFTYQMLQNYLVFNPTRIIWKDSTAIKHKKKVMQELKDFLWTDFKSYLADFVFVVQ